MSDIVLVGEAVAGESTKCRKELEKLLTNLDKSTFDIAELLHKIKSHRFYQGWGHNTFREYATTLKMNLSKAYYLVRIVEVMNMVGAKRADYEPLGINKLREISSLDPNSTYTEADGQTNPMKSYIVGLLAKAGDMELEEVKEHVRTLKGLVGDDALVFVTFCVKKSVRDNVVFPALELAKKNIGSLGRNEDGEAIEPSNGNALEKALVEYMNDPSNNYSQEEIENANKESTQVTQSDTEI